MSGELIAIWGVGADLAGRDGRISGLEALDSQDELEEPPNPWKMD